MKKKFIPIKMMLIALLFVICMFPNASYAETGSVIIAADTSVKVGDTLTVTVKYAASGLSLIDGELRYDPDMLKFVSGGTSSNPAGGVIKMNKTLKGETSQLFTIRFVAVGAGSDFFLVNTFQLKDGAGNDLGTPGASVKLNVSAVATEPVPQDPEITPEEPVTDPSTETPNEDDDPAIIDDLPATDAEKETAPDTLWVFVGAIAATTVFLVISLIVVNRKKKPEK